MRAPCGGKGEKNPGDTDTEQPPQKDFFFKPTFLGARNRPPAEGPGAGSRRTQKGPQKGPGRGVIPPSVVRSFQGPLIT